MLVHRCTLAASARQVASQCQPAGGTLTSPSSTGRPCFGATRRCHCHGAGRSSYSRLSSAFEHRTIDRGLHGGCAVCRHMRQHCRGLRCVTVRPCMQPARIGYPAAYRVVIVCYKNRTRAVDCAEVAPASAFERHEAAMPPSHVRALDYDLPPSPRDAAVGTTVPLAPAPARLCRIRSSVNAAELSVSASR